MCGEYRMKKKISAIIVAALLFTTVASSGLVCSCRSLIAAASPGGEEINVNLEYSNGTIGSLTGDLALWYTWVNVNSTQIIYLAYQSYKYRPPVITFLGQHYRTEDNTEVFVGNTLTAMEVYNDTNGNGVPDVDLLNGTSEILYNFAVNSSASFNITSVQKSLSDSVPHYTWGIRYNSIDAFLLTENQESGAAITLDYLSLSYDFYVQNNVSYIKTNFKIGKILHMTPYPSNTSITLDGLSLSLLYGTTVITSEHYVTLVNGEPYNSTTTQTSAEPTNSSEIRIKNTKAYEYLFGQNYTLFKGSLNETCQSHSAGVADRSVPGGLYQRVDWLLSNLEDILSTVFPKISSMQTAINLNYNVSSFLYRVCYPEWEGYGLEHDPTYIAYLNPIAVPEMSPPMLIVVAAALAGIVALTVAVSDLKKTRRILKPSMQDLPTASIR